MPDEKKKCAHEPCVCAAAAGRAYCSDYCEHAATSGPRAWNLSADAATRAAAAEVARHLGSELGSASTYPPSQQRVAFVPARRGGPRLDPIVALRHE